ncbi:MAG: alkaline phosphatase family protein [Bacilli bacterium]|nr:alkaline phosphatase family protein [Bacilli bacterium]
MKVYNENTLVNLSNSILKHFGAPTFHETNKIVDQELKGHKKVVAVLFDGMGRNIVHKHLKEKSFIRQHYVTTINSVYPPTTAAATTSFLTGKYPIETGWLGWTTYFKDYDKNVILFRSVDYNTGDLLIKEGEQHIAYKYFPLTYIFELIEKANPAAKAYNISRFPIFPDGPKSLKKGVEMVSKKLKENDECFIYFYWDSPDYEMHSYGIDSKKVKKEVLKAEKFLKSVTKKNKDTLFILLADHGHINVTFLDICEKKDIYSLLSKPLTLEKRTPSFFVKEGKHEEFKKLFNKYYGNSFELLTKQEALDMKLFGEGEPAKGVEDVFGDFVAIAKKEYAIYPSEELKFIDNFKGHHAGGTEEERLIDISIFK